MEPIKHALRIGVQIELEITDGVSTIREKGVLLVQLVALRLGHFKQATFRFLVKGLYEGKALTGDGGSDASPRVNASRLFPAITSNHPCLCWARTYPPSMPTVSSPLGMGK
jgi:hypothetical protein